MKNNKLHNLLLLCFLAPNSYSKPKEKYKDLEAQTAPKASYLKPSKETLCKLKLFSGVAATAGLTYFGANGYPALLPAAGVPATMCRIYLRALTEKVDLKYKAPIASLITIGGFISDLKFVPLGIGSIGLGWLTNMGKRAEKVKLKFKNGDIKTMQEQIKALQKQAKLNQTSNELVEVKTA